jgi:hypothetical protein
MQTDVPDWGTGDGWPVLAVSESVCARAAVAVCACAAITHLASLAVRRSLLSDGPAGHVVRNRTELCCCRRHV